MTGQYEVGKLVSQIAVGTVVVLDGRTTMPQNQIWHRAVAVATSDWSEAIVACSDINSRWTTRYAVTINTSPGQRSE